MNKAGAGAGLAEKVDVFAIVEETELIRSGDIERRDVAQHQFVVARPDQRRARAARNFIGRERSGDREETLVRHQCFAGAGGGTPGAGSLTCMVGSCASSRLVTSAVISRLFAANSTAARVRTMFALCSLATWAMICNAVFSILVI